MVRKQFRNDPEMARHSPEMMRNSREILGNLFSYKINRTVRHFKMLMSSMCI